MFPNFRLIIGAVAASVVALSCGFGVFAALRVNQEPLSRLPAATAPLQLVAEDLAPPTVLSGRPPSAGEPEIATTVADESARESARNDGGETPSSTPSITEPDAVASVADQKTQAAAQPADPPATRANSAGKESGGDSSRRANMIQTGHWAEASKHGATLFGGLADANRGGGGEWGFAQCGGAPICGERELRGQADATVPADRQGDAGTARQEALCFGGA